MAQREFRSIVESLTRRLPQRLVLVDDPGLIEGSLHIQHGLLRRFEHGVEPAQNCHRQDHVAVLTAYI